MAEQKKSPEQEKNLPVEKKPTPSERFSANIQKQFEAEAGSPVMWTEYERQLAQHLFLKIDSSLKDAEKKRASNNAVPYTWENVNMRKLALDAVNRVQLGLDALLPATVYPICYFNTREGKYDVDLRVGYRGKDYYRRAAALDPPIAVRYELVYSTDKFSAIKADFRHEYDSYEFEITQAFDRGDVVGGFAYFVYDDPRKNVLVTVSEAEFKKSQNQAKSQDFWGKFPVEMRFKTLVHRATDHLAIDPKKVNASAYAYVESQDQEGERIYSEFTEDANSIPITLPEEAITIEDAPETPQDDVPDAQQRGPGF
ncbi:recombinase RecT [Eubacteriales bacterium OttesenSCG-928-N13]|nr:recombinase RecT [Eubacteriales bacterium OttesenSCG-928-N13]